MIARTKWTPSTLVTFKQINVTFAAAIRQRYNKRHKKLCHVQSDKNRKAPPQSCCGSGEGKPTTDPAAQTVARLEAGNRLLEQSEGWNTGYESQSNWQITTKSTHTHTHTQAFSSHVSWSCHGAAWRMESLVSSKHQAHPIVKHQHFNRTLISCVWEEVSFMVPVI